ncbi:DUF5597 domain-containing protein [Paenibacillus sp. MMS20-IR301]|uniref:DUF5597 domain-containing protein n=1 Tax=Paenibacillus sp. MMS20-IR301 TaxID=2895946 RepID=UPI0028E7CCBD|nr:DUF5597 domain-containing protein [Paenibacillus sp. MMS20-IR301]WNS40775.1 DUF5597 domain-containing protein [Paenibacillus sp. MMS20-IR301]
MQSIPYLERDNQGLTTLWVDGKPFVALGGEIHNSSASSLTYMAEQVWPSLRGLHLNTLIVPIYWEQLEPVQHQFDYSLVDGIIEQAREEQVRLVFLWFGLWKNGVSSYVPEWVKRDYTTYFRACYKGDIPSTTISPLCEAAVAADAKAFTSLMKHLKDVDGEQNTVIMVQVENEIGFLASARDYSALAEAGFAGEVPPLISGAYARTGTWSEVFGEEADESFMAYHYACAVEQIASSGAKEYPLPLFVNAWLEQFPKRPGAYPSGGPVAKMMKIWKLAAPSIALYAPDIYLPDFAGICAEYTAGGNPLFIPEARRDLDSAANVFYAVGKHNALCFAPFGIEDFLKEPADGDSGADAALLLTLNIDKSGFTLNGTGPFLADSYRLLGSMIHTISGYRGTGCMRGFLQNHERGTILPFAGYDIQITYQRKEERQPVSGGLVIQTAEDEFIIAGMRFTAEWLPKRGEQAMADYIRIEEGMFVNDVWCMSRVLNGDEASRISVKSKPAALKVKMYKYK